jgi:hypothetical protein
LNTRGPSPDGAGPSKSPPGTDSAVHSKGVPGTDRSSTWYLGRRSCVALPQAGMEWVFGPEEDVLLEHACAQPRRRGALQGRAWHRGRGALQVGKEVGQQKTQG